MIIRPHQVKKCHWTWAACSDSDHPAHAQVTIQGLVIQSVVSLTSSLRAISLTILADSVYNFLKFVCWKNVSNSHFFSKKFHHICISLDVNFNESLTNDIVSFEQLGPGLSSSFIHFVVSSDCVSGQWRPFLSAYASRHIFTWLCPIFVIFCSKTYLVGTNRNHLTEAIPIDSPSGDHEIFSTVILSLPLIQEGQLSVSGERMCTILVNRLED